MSCPLAPCLMVQGTASSVGKSILVAGLCRLVARRGIRVAPFKSQNMSLNAAVTPDGFEIGRAQAVQAEAAGVAARVEMNPILLKPEGERRSQVVVLGRPIGRMSAVEYHVYKPRLRERVAESLRTLRTSFDLVLIEGAGSPAEVNLAAHDIVNMHVARIADAPVILIGDIDRGGVFASLVGTMELLAPEDRARVRGFVINRFRGDPALLASGLDFLAERTGVPVLGVIPWIDDLRIAEEDSVGLDRRVREARPAGPDDLDVAVIRFPRASNHDDLDPLVEEPGVTVRWIETPEGVESADLAILPGSKSTVADLAWMRERGFDRALVRRAEAGRPVLGICGGCQMLGRVVEDPEGVESDRPRTEGLGLLPFVTRFAGGKRTADVRFRAVSPAGLLEGLSPSDELVGYEIHMGRIEVDPGVPRPFAVLSRNGEAAGEPDGVVAADGAVVGTMIHGLLANDAVRGAILAALRRRRGLPEPPPTVRPPTRREVYDRLADHLEAALDPAQLDRLVSRTRSARS